MSYHSSFTLLFWKLPVLNSMCPSLCLVSVSSSLASSPCLAQSAGVMSVYLFMKRYAAEELYRPHPSFYRPRLSDCSDHSGQFLHPEAWARGRSPSDLSSEASLQMSASYPALLKCPEYEQVTSSPCWGPLITTASRLPLIPARAPSAVRFETGREGAWKGGIWLEPRKT